LLFCSHDFSAIKQNIEISKCLTPTAIFLLQLADSCHSSSLLSGVYRFL